MSRPHIAGTGMTSFGEHPDRPGRDLFAEAALAALDDADLKPDDVDEVFFGNFVGTLSENQGHQGPLMSEVFGSTAPQNVSKARVPQLAWRYATQSAPSGTARPT